MNIEDLTIILATSTVNYNSWDGKLIYSLADQVSKNIGFTEKQNTQCIRILRRYVLELSKFIGTDIVQYINSPVYKLPFRTIAIDKKISIDTINDVRLIKVEFPYNDSYVSSFRSNRYHNDPKWNPDNKSWLFDLNEKNIHFLMKFSNDEQFQVDDEFCMFAEQVTSILQNMEDHAPMLILENGVPKFKNIADSMPALTTTGILESVFFARKCGITIWDTSISNYISSTAVSKITSNFLNSNTDKHTKINCSTNDISCLTDIVIHMTPCLIVIPGGDELSKLIHVTKFLIDSGIETCDMSVMFRLPSKTGKEFNEYVKEKQLNNPMTKNTKIVFVSGNIPKPVFQSEVQFNCVIDLGFGGVRYSLKDYVASHQNLIYYVN